MLGPFDTQDVLLPFREDSTSLSGALGLNAPEQTSITEKWISEDVILIAI